MWLTVCNWTAQFSFAFVSCCIFYTVSRPSSVAHVGCACEAKFVSSSCLLLYSIFHTASCFAATSSLSLSLSMPHALHTLWAVLLLLALSFRLPSASKAQQPLPRPARQSRLVSNPNKCAHLAFVFHISRITTHSKKVLRKICQKIFGSKCFPSLLLLTSPLPTRLGSILQRLRWANFELHH